MRLIFGRDLPAFQNTTQTLSDTVYGLLAYAGYSVLIGVTWRWIDPYKPLAPQIKGMRAYRLFDVDGQVQFESTINPSYE